MVPSSSNSSEAEPAAAAEVPDGAQDGGAQDGGAQDAKRVAEEAAKASNRAKYAKAVAHMTPGFSGAQVKKKKRPGNMWSTVYV